MNPRTEMTPPTGQTDGKKKIQQRRDNLESMGAGRRQGIVKKTFHVCSKRTLSRGQRWETWQALIQVSTLTWRTDGREGGLEAGGQVGGHHRDLGMWWYPSTPQQMVEKKGWFHISGHSNSLGEGWTRRKNFWAGFTLRSGRLQRLSLCRQVQKNRDNPPTWREVCELHGILWQLFLYDHTTMHKGGFMTDNNKPVEGLLWWSCG